MITAAAAAEHSLIASPRLSSQQEALFLERGPPPDSSWHPLWDPGRGRRRERRPPELLRRCNSLAPWDGRTLLSWEGGGRGNLLYHGSRIKLPSWTRRRTDSLSTADTNTAATTYYEARAGSVSRFFSRKSAGFESKSAKKSASLNCQLFYCIFGRFKGGLLFDFFKLF